MELRQIVATSGMLVGADDQRENFDLVRYAIDVSRRPEGARVCYIPTAVGDSKEAVDFYRKAFREKRPDVELSFLTLFTQPSVPDIRAHLLAQDVVIVEGGSVVNLLAVWRAHGLDRHLREAWESGVVLSGASAGSICWHTGGPTDSFGDDLVACRGGLGFLPFSNGVHDDFGGQTRRSTYRSMVAKGELGAGYASEDGVGLHYVGTSLARVVTLRPRSSAWQVEPDGHGGYVEERLAADLL